MMDSNKLYREVVTERVIRLRHEVVSEFESLGLVVMQPSAFMHERTIDMALAVQGMDDEAAKLTIRPIVRHYVRVDAR